MCGTGGGATQKVRDAHARQGQKLKSSVELLQLKVCIPSQLYLTSSSDGHCHHPDWLLAQQQSLNSAPLTVYFQQAAAYERCTSAFQASSCFSSSTWQ